MKTVRGTLLLSVAAVAGMSLTASPDTRAEVKPKPAISTEMAQAEARVAQIRELVRPWPGEHVANMARIAWEHDPWEAAVKAAREGKPVLAYGECAAGVPCGYG